MFTHLLVAVTAALCALPVTAGSPALAETGSVWQSIEFLPPWTSVVGESMTLDATASSGLAVSYAANPSDRCSMDGQMLRFLTVGDCDVTASQPGDDTWAAASDVTRTITAFRGYRATATVTAPGGAVRNDDSVRVGDTLAVTVTPIDDVRMETCAIGVYGRGGGQMTSFQMHSGTCALSVTIPDFQLSGMRDGVGRPANDICVAIENPMLRDGETLAMAASDRLQPGGKPCDGSRGTEALDFRLEDGGAARTFTSDPPIVSWNPADWPVHDPLAFGTTARFALPSYAQSSCKWSMNGAWQTIITTPRAADCPEWRVRLPGVLPEDLPWPGGPGAWGVDITAEYVTGEGYSGHVISSAEVPYSPSDGVFESNLSTIFPTDLATSRFATAGEDWTPTFRATGAEPSTCTLELVKSGEREDHEATSVDSDGTCHFSVPAAAVDRDSIQYFVLVDGSWDLTYGGNVQVISAPAPPVVGTSSEGGDTVVSAGTDGEHALLLDVDVQPATDPGAARPASSADAARDCSGIAAAPDVEQGGSVPSVHERCALTPGKYVATARVFDVTGKRRTITRAFTVTGPGPTIVSRSQLPGVRHVRRDVTPSVVFDGPVTGISTTTFLLRDATTRTPVRGAVRYQPSHHRAIFEPDRLLAPGDTYTITLTRGIRSVSGGRLVPESWSFRVTPDGRRPTFRWGSLDGSRGAGCSDDLALLFSEAIRGVPAGSVHLEDARSASDLRTTITYDARRLLATIHPQRALEPQHAYRLVVGHSIVDLAGNPVVSGTLTFQTGQCR